VCVCERERERERRQLLGGASVGRCHGLLEELARGLRHGDARAGRGLCGGRRSRGKEAVAAGAGQGTGGKARGGGMPVPDDAGGSGEAGGGGVRVEGWGRGGVGCWGAEDERGDSKTGG